MRTARLRTSRNSRPRACRGIPLRANASVMQMIHHHDVLCPRTTPASTSWSTCGSRVSILYGGEAVAQSLTISEIIGFRERIVLACHTGRLAARGARRSVAVGSMVGGDALVYHAPRGALTRHWLAPATRDTTPSPPNYGAAHYGPLIPMEPTDRRWDTVRVDYSIRPTTIHTHILRWTILYIPTGP